MPLPLNETHDPARKSLVESANAPGCDFPIQNLALSAKSGSARHIRNRERRMALSNALKQLNQLTATLRPIIAASDDKLANEGLGLLYNWLHDERERLTEDHD
jgi:hypothetical protein